MNGPMHVMSVFGSVNGFPPARAFTTLHTSLTDLSVSHRPSSKVRHPRKHKICRGIDDSLLDLAITMADKVDAPTSSSTDASSIPREGTGSGGPKAIIKNVDMSEDMQQESVDIASTALEKFNVEKDIAAQIKKEFDRRHGPTWHVVVGKNFGSYVTHGESQSYPALLSLQNISVLIDLVTITETKHFIYFYVGSLAILIWKS